MINKGIIEEVNGELRVRVLENNGEKGKAGATASNDLPVPLFIYVGNLKDQYQDGDKVVVCYEKDDIEKPIVLGRFVEAAQTTTNASFNNIEVDNRANLPQATTIGKITAKEIAALSGVQSNIQGQLRDLDKKLIVAAEKKSLEIKRFYTSANPISESGEIKLQTSVESPTGYVLIGSDVQLHKGEVGKSVSFQYDLETGIYTINLSAAEAGGVIKIVETYRREEEMEWRITKAIIE